jgi:hypothetical protein
MQQVRQSSELVPDESREGKQIQQQEIAEPRQMSLFLFSLSSSS